MPEGTRGGKGQPATTSKAVNKALRTMMIGITKHGRNALGQFVKKKRLELKEGTPEQLAAWKRNQAIRKKRQRERRRKERQPHLDARNRALELAANQFNPDVMGNAWWLRNWYLSGQKTAQELGEQTLDPDKRRKRGR